MLCCLHSLVALQVILYVSAKWKSGGFRPEILSIYKFLCLVIFSQFMNLISNQYIELAVFSVLSTIVVLPLRLSLKPDSSMLLSQSVDASIQTRKSASTSYSLLLRLTILTRFGKCLKFCKRYIDDALAIRHSSEDALQNNFKTAFSSLGILTREVEQRSTAVTFMDITISIEYDKLTTKIYEKSQNLYLYYLPAGS